MDLLPAKIAIGEAPEFFEYDAQTGEFTGLFAPFYKDVFIRARLNVSYTASRPSNFQGRCDEFRHCTDNLEMLNTQDWDYTLVQVSNTGLDYVDYLPFKLDAEAFEANYRVMSCFELSDNQDVDVMSSFKNISLGVLALYIGWFVVAYAMNVGLKKVLLSVSAELHYNQSYVWQIARMYYNGYYSTDSTVRPRPETIENLKQLAVSDKPAVLLHGDPIILFLNTSRDPMERTIIDGIVFDSNGKSNSIVAESQADGMPPASFAHKIRKENGAAIVANFYRQPVEYFYCQQLVSDSGDDDKPSEPSLHNSDEQFYETIFFHVFHPNISFKLASRLHTALLRTTETRVLSVLLVDHVLDIFLDMMGETPTREVTECLNHKQEASNEVRPLRPVNIRLVLIVGMSAILGAILVAISELGAAVYLRMKKDRPRSKLFMIRKVKADQ
ncbi:hypothetical protein HDE_04014 [Halotydeus destructor]|nr:hypothetical protein HDE_04014 [Halotydeus destructor]